MIKKKILVTGATGFMGTYFVKELLKNQYDVRILVRNEKLARDKFGDNCEIILGDITKPDSIAGCCKDMDIVVHLAALMGHDLPSEEAFNRFRAINVQGTKNILEECKNADVKRFIHVSSTAAMGLLDDPIVNEETTCKPYTPYQVTKYESEKLVLEEHKKSGFPSIVLRPSMVYGPGFKGDFLTMAKICKKGIFPKIGKGENLSPALYITDLIDALVLFLEKGDPGQVYLISSERSYSLHETGVIISDALDKKVRFIYVPVGLALFGVGILEKIAAIRGKHSPVTRRNIRSMVTDRVFDISKAKAVGFIQKVQLKEGLKKAVEYFLEQGYI